jgi:hypothetical protein
MKDDPQISGWCGLLQHGFLPNRDVVKTIFNNMPGARSRGGGYIAVGSDQPNPLAIGRGAQIRFEQWA